jgi:hypothetical protein
MSRSPFAITFAAIVAVACSNCALRQARVTDVPDRGIPSCVDGAARDLLSPDALQCWFDASHGRWRTLNHQSHLEALVVEVEARDLRDAHEIARRVVAGDSAKPFSEILVYVRTQSERGASRRRRIRWTRGGAFDALDFSSPDADAPLTVRSSP